MTAAVAALRRDTVQAAGAFAAGLLLLVIFLALSGFAVGPALDALWNGAFGSWYNFTSAVLVRGTPLALLGLAFMLGSRSGALNIGMEGQFAVGAIGATAVALHCGSLTPLLAVTLTLLAGAAGGLLWIAVPVWLRVRHGITEVISTLLLTFVGYAAVSYAITGPLQEPARVYPESALIPVATRLPHLWSGSRLHAGFLVVVVITAAMAFLLNRSRWGVAIRATGTAPRAAALVGRINVTRVSAVALLASGGLAGLGGGMEVSGVSYALYQNLSPGYGYTAIAVALLGREQPWLVFLTGILFGALEAGGAAMQRDAGIPAVAVQVVEGVVILVMLLTARRRTA
ncbi:MAG TPA: ABC transporter permease [Gemmatimonadales bacterium]|jgi:simple sugar transport system permease protein